MKVFATFMAYQQPNSCLLIFCKAPVPGQVKTRLIPFLSAEKAADLHIQLATRTLQILGQTDICPVQLWCSPSIEHPFFKECAETFNLSLHTQQGSNLGERMHHALCSALSDYEHAILIGCDCPSLAIIDMYEALTALKQKHHVVLAPAEDGGYVLIGLNNPQPELFSDIDWGKPTVLESTRSSIKQSKLCCHELQEQWDVDFPKDLKRLTRTLFIPQR